MSDETKSRTPKRQMNLQLQMDEETAQGRYVNFAMVNHTPTEFVFDFVYMQPQQPRGKVLSRVITSPVHAKRLMMALTENLKKYEQRFGTIPLPAVKPSEPVVH
jgi:hypothetical protein